MTIQTVTPTPEQFMASTDPDEPEALDPLESIAATLARLVDLTENGPAPAADHPDTELLQSLREEHADLQSYYNAAVLLIDQVTEIVRPSTSKLADSVRAAIDEWRGVEASEPESTAETGEPGTEPTDPAVLDPTSLESLRAHAASRGIEGADQLNRSQLRTALGIPHPSSE